MKRIAFVVEVPYNQKLYICDADCREVLSEHFSNENRLVELLNTAGVDTVVVAPVPEYRRAMIKTLQFAGFNVHQQFLTDAPEDDRRFANVASELLYHLHVGEDGDETAVNDLMKKTSDRTIWRTQNKAKKNLDIRLSIMMAYHRKYCL